MAARDLQVLVIVDVYPVVSEEELKSQLPDERDDRIVLRLSDFDAPRIEPPPDASPIDWPAIGRAVEALAANVRARRAEKSNPTILYVGGRGPLAVFVHLGYLFSKFGGSQVVLNQPPGGGRWERFDMDAPVAGAAGFVANTGLPAVPVSSSGRVGFYLDTSGRDTPDEVLASFLEEESDSVAGIVKLRSRAPLLVTPENITAITRELTELLSMAPSRYRRRSGLALFVAAPAQLAFALGRSINPNVVGGDVWLTHHRAPSYELVYALPFAADAAPSIPRADGDELARRHILDAMIASIDELKAVLAPEHLPDDVLPAADRGKFIERLRALKHVRKESDSFEMRVLRGEFTLGAGLLEAFRRSTEQQVKDFAKLLFLHELLHDRQDIRSTNHFEIGRAGVVLEQIDFAADAFALRTLMAMELDVGGQRARNGAREILKKWIEASLHGVESFDMMEQGAVIKRLPERRLRRYLAWHLQLARASTVTDPSHVDELLRPALTVELAPLAGRLDTRRFDKVVLRALPGTELFCAIGGHLVREPARPGFDPGALVDAVRSYAAPVIQSAMIALVDEHRAKLAPWRM